MAIVSALSVFAVGCNDTSGPTYAIGDVVVVVTDANGAPADSVHVNLMLTDKATLWRTAVTGSDGKAQFGTEDGGVLVQDYLVFFPIQLQWALAAGETNYKPVKAVENQTVTVEFKVQKIVVNPR
jgi:5-hydroxyisourate hydrolase-like protein (transthyretin family)